MFKTEVIKLLGPWKSVSPVEWEVLKWADEYDNTRLHSAIDYQTLSEAEKAVYETLNPDQKAA